MFKDIFKNKHAPMLALAGLAVCFIFWEMFSSFSVSDVKVLDARVTFKFTAFADRDQYFVSYSLENKKKAKVKAQVKVQLGNSSLGGKMFRVIQKQTDIAMLEPLEMKSFVVQMDLPKPKDGKNRELNVHAKVKRVVRA